MIQNFSTFKNLAKFSHNSRLQSQSLFSCHNNCEMQLSNKELDHGVK